MLLNSYKKIINYVAFTAQIFFLAFFANFFQFWMVVYTAIIFFLKFSIVQGEKVEKFEVDPIFAKKNIKKLMGGDLSSPPPLT